MSSGPSVQVLQPVDAPPQAHCFEDHWRRFHRVRAHLQNSRGVKYTNFVQQLKPNHWRVWVELALGYVALIAIAWAVVLLQVTFGLIHWTMLSIPLAAGAFGWTIAYISLFVHEAAHYYLATSRALNDLLCNAVIGVLLGEDIAAYRPIHFAHHRNLGTIDDTERTYFDPLNTRLVVDGLTGLKAARVIRAAC